MKRIRCAVIIFLLVNLVGYTSAQADNFRSIHRSINYPGCHQESIRVILRKDSRVAFISSKQSAMSTSCSLPANATLILRPLDNNNDTSFETWIWQSPINHRNEKFRKLIITVAADNSIDLNLI